MRLEYRVKNSIILFSAMILCGAIAVVLGKELGWDLANYHYYNPHAYLHQRWHLDYWPASNPHVRFTPTADFLTYFLINYFSALPVVFILGAIHGINFWLIYRIACLYLKESQVVLPIVLAGLGMYGATSWSQIGSFQNDNLVSIFVLGFFWMQASAFQYLALNQKIP
ncbi:MAG: hypothetical protein ACYCQI_11310, partial [Gammaproteobacteria bacterium]